MQKTKWKRNGSQDHVSGAGDEFSIGNNIDDFIGAEIPIEKRRKAKDFSAMKNRYWKSFVLVWWLPPMFSVITFFYFLSILVFNKFTIGKVVRIGLCVLVLMILPWYHPSDRKWSSFHLALSATGLLVSVLLLEGYFARQQCLSSYLSLAIVYRVIRFKTLFDNFAICLVYSADIITLRSSAQPYFIVSKLVLWSSFILGIMMYKVLRRATFRIWDHTHLLLIYREKSIHESNIANSAIRAHIPDNFIRMMSENDERIKPFLKKTKNSASRFPGASSLVWSACKLGILRPFSDCNPSIDKLALLDGMDRRFAAVIAVKFDVGQDKECELITIDNFKIFDLFDTLASRRKITSIRKFGDVWIGCMGFLHSEGKATKDCREVLTFAAEIMELADSLRLNICCAIDCGNIIGGFVGSIHFDIYGSEIRWVLSMVEARKNGCIITSLAFKQMVSQASHDGSSKTMNDKIEDISFDRTFVQPFWKPGGLEKVYAVLNRSVLINKNALMEYLSNTNIRGSPNFFDWEKLRNSASATASVGTSSSKNAADDFLQAVCKYSMIRVSFEMISSFLNEICVDADLGYEFHSTLYERYGLSLDDPIFDGYSDEEIISQHVVLENLVIKLIKTKCFSSFWRVVFLYSVDDYEQVKASDLAEDPLKFYDSIPMPTMTEMFPVLKYPILMLLRLRPVFESLVFFTSYIYNLFWCNDQSSGGVRRVYASVDGKSSSTPSRQVDSEQSISWGNVENMKVNEGILSRGWVSYSENIRHVFDNYLGLIVVQVFFIVCSLFVLAMYYPGRESLLKVIYFDPFMFFISLQVISAWVLLRENYRSAFLLIVISRLLFLYYTPQYFFSSSVHLGLDNVFQNNQSIYDSFGDFGGESHFKLLFLISTPMIFRQMFSRIALDQILIILMLLSRIGSPGQGLSKTSWCAITLSIIFRLFIVWIIEIRLFVSYIVEHKLLEEARIIYEYQLRNSKEVLLLCTPMIPHRHALELFSPKRYRNCAIVALHIRAADILPGILEPRDVCLFLQRIYRVIDSCIIECGLLKVTKFSGVVLAVACKDVSWDAVDGNRLPLNHISRAVMFVRTVQRKIDALNNQDSFHVSLGIAMNHGSLTMGFYGNSRYCFDVVGNARDVACAMASFQTDGSIYSSEHFTSEIGCPGKALDDFQLTSSFTVSSGNSEVIWYKIDGNFSGIDLTSFEYLFMLGKGGYGSVHLLREITSGKKYAIKAIPRKQGSSMSKLIQREFNILQQMDHPNVVHFHYCMIYKTRIFLVMTYIRGGNLRQVIERDSPKLSQLRHWFAELVLAIEYLHSRGIIHRDVKPANCMIAADGHLQLADFGLSKIVSVQESEETLLDNNNASSGLSQRALNAIKTLLPLKPRSKHSGISEKAIEILLIDGEEPSKMKVHLSVLYYSVTVVSDMVKASSELSKSDCTFDLVMINIDSFDSVDIIRSYKELRGKIWEKSLSSKDSRIVTDDMKLDVISKFSSLDQYFGIPVIVLSEIDDTSAAMHYQESGAKEVFSHSNLESSRDVIWKYVRHFRFQRMERLEDDESRPHNVVASLAKNSDDMALAIRQSHEGIASLMDRNPSRDLDSKEELKSMGSSFSLSKDLSSRSSIGTSSTKFETESETRSGIAGSRGAQSHSAVGTLHFMAPEVIRDRKYNRNIDWWACGVSFYECVMHEHVFRGSTKEEIMVEIVEGTIDLSSLLNISKPFHSLVSGFLERDPSKRLGTHGATLIKQHTFFSNINWNSVSTEEAPYRPTIPDNQKMEVDLSSFYGDVEIEKKERSENSLNGSKKQDNDNGKSIIRRISRQRRRTPKSQEHFERMSAIRKKWITAKPGVVPSKRFRNPTVGPNANADFSIGRVPEEDESIVGELSEGHSLGDHNSHSETKEAGNTLSKA